MSAIAAKAAEYDSDEDLVPTMIEEESEEVQEEVEVDTSLNNPNVVAKYQECALICNQVIASVSAMCIPDASVHDICKGGDDLVNELTKNLYQKKVNGRKIDKGIAFPICVSVNDCICHMSPLTSEEPILLKAGDLVKIDMGVHLDGYITVTANTVIVGHDPNTPTTGPLADVFTAAWACAEVAARMITPGAANTDVTAAMKRICEAYDVRPLSGSVMHQVKRYVIDGNKNIGMHDNVKDEGKVEKCTFEQGEVFALDICLTTSDGKRKEKSTRTTVYRRVVNAKYGLKIASSRKFLNEINDKFPALPFTLRMLDDENLAKMGVRECAGHELVTPYGVLWDTPGNSMAHIKYTILLTANGNVKVTGMPIPAGLVSDKVLPEDLKELIASSSIEKKKKNRAPKKKKA